MYNLFNSEARLKQTNITMYGLDYVKRELLATQVNRYKQYRALNPGYLKNDHILARILGMVDIPFMGDLPDYYLQVSRIVNRLAGQMGFVTSAHHGRVSEKNDFYGKGISEIFIAIADDEISMADIWFNWRDMSPIRVLSHPVAGCGIIELNGSVNLPGSKPGAVAVIEINIPLLACQYQLWRMAVRSLAPEGTALSTAHFLTQVVIPNALLSHLDIAVMNTMHALMGADDYTKVESDMPFYTADFYPKLEAGLKELIGRFTRENYFYKDILSNIPVFGNESLIQAIKMPDIAYTNQAIWALMIARLPVVAMLLKFDELGNNRKNDADRNRIRRSLAEADSGKYLVNQIPSYIADAVGVYITKNIRDLL